MEKSKSMEYLSINLKAYRLAAKLTQEDLAEKVGVSSQAIINLENQLNWIKSDTLDKIADFFNVEPACLLKAPSSVVGELDEKTKLDALNSLSVDYLYYLEKRLSHSFKK